MTVTDLGIQRDACVRMSELETTYLVSPRIELQEPSKNLWIGPNT